MEQVTFNNKSIIAIKIYLGGPYGICPMADLRTVDGVTETIDWTDIKQRKEFDKYITGYTYIYDTRPKPDISEYFS